MLAATTSVTVTSTYFSLTATATRLLLQLLLLSAVATYSFYSCALPHTLLQEHVELPGLRKVCEF